MKSVFYCIIGSIFLLNWFNLSAKTVMSKLELNEATITSSNFDIGDVWNLFDDDITTIARSANINPAWVKIEFDKACQIDSIAVFIGQTGVDSDVNQWWVEIADNNSDLDTKTGSYKMIVSPDNNVMGVWDSKRINQLSAKIWKFSFKRTVGDNYVHIWELGLYYMRDLDLSPLKFNFKHEVNANNIVLNYSDYMPIDNAYDGFISNSHKFKSKEVFVNITYKIPRKFKSMRLNFKNNSKWQLEYADKYSDIKFSNANLKSFPERTATAGKWDTLNFENGFESKHWRLKIMSLDDNPVEINEMEFFSFNEADELSGMQANIELWENWTWKNIQNKLLYRGDKLIPIEQITFESLSPDIASVDSKGIIKALKSGDAKIIAKYANSTCTTKVKVLKPVKNQEIEKLSDFLSSPAKDFVYELPILIIQYIPTRDGINKDPVFSPDLFEYSNITIEATKQRNLETINRFKFALEQGSKFRGYKNKDARPSIGIKVVDYITIYEPFPPSVRNYCYDNGILEYALDFDEIFRRVNLKDYVENKGVKMVWLWGGGLNATWGAYDGDFHSPEAFRSAFESYMSTPTIHMACNGANPEPLPIYNKTYTVINQFQSYPAYSSINFEPFTHQFESIWTYQNQLHAGNTDFFWKLFVGKMGRCGWTHMPPNTDKDYYYMHYIQIDTNLVKPTWSDIEDWKPDNSGEKKLISHHSWEDIKYEWPDGINEFGERYELQWFIYWLNAIPGYENNIPYNLNSKNYRCSNWWKFLYDWDTYTSKEIGLWEEIPNSIFENRANDISVFPNPGNGIFTVSLKELEEIKKIEVYNNLACLVAQIEDISGSRIRDLDLSGLPNAVYTLKITSNENVYFKTIIKQ